MQFSFKKKNNQIKEKTKQTKWWSFNLEETFDRLNSNEKGLKTDQVKKIREKIGLNILPKKGKLTSLAILWSQIKSTMVVMLIVAALISLILGDTVNAAVIMLAVILNIAVGFWQEFKTSKALEALEQIVTSQAKVLRD